MCQQNSDLRPRLCAATLRDEGDEKCARTLKEDDGEIEDNKVGQPIRVGFDEGQSGVEEKDFVFLLLLFISF